MAASSVTTVSQTQSTHLTLDTHLYVVARWHLLCTTG